VGSYQFSVSGLTSPNYDFVYKDGTLSVQQATIRLIWENVTNRQWMDGKKVTVAIFEGDIKGNDEVTVVLSGADASAMGTHTVTAQLSGVDAGNYTLEASSEQRKFTISKRMLTFVPQISNWSYGDQPASPSIASGSTLISVRYDGDNYSSSTPPQHAGKYSVTVICESNNTLYTGCANFEVQPRELRVARMILEDRPYEKGNKALHVLEISLFNIAYEDQIDIDLTTLFATVSSDSVGDYSMAHVKGSDIVLVGALSNNYTVVDCNVSVFASIIPAEIQANVSLRHNDVIYYDGQPKEPEIIVEYGGQLISPSEYTVHYNNNVEVGMATITIGDVAGGNYIIKGSRAFTILMPDPLMSTEQIDDNEIDDELLQPKGCLSLLCLESFAIIAMLAFLMILLMHKRRDSI